MQPGGNQARPWVVILLFNGLEMSKIAIQSLREQTVKPHILAINNGSTDNTQAWLNTQKDLEVMAFARPKSVAGAWNKALQWLFITQNQQQVLVVNNDVKLRPDTYQRLMEDGGGFVTAVGSDDPNKIETSGEPDPSKKRPHPDFSCYMLRRWVYETTGPFNEAFEGAYCEDSDYHIRMHRKGIHATSLDLPFYHIGAGSIKSVDPVLRRQIQKAADANRERFKRMYGFGVGTPEYYQAFNSAPPEKS